MAYDSEPTIIDIESYNPRLGAALRRGMLRGRIARVVEGHDDAVYVTLSDDLDAAAALAQMAVLVRDRPNEVHMMNPDGTPSQYTVRLWWD